MTDKRLNKTCHSAKTKFVPRGKLLDPPESYGPRAFWCVRALEGWTSQPCSCLKSKK